MKVTEEATECQGATPAATWQSTSGARVPEYQIGGGPSAIEEMEARARSPAASLEEAVEAERMVATASGVKT